MQARMDRVMLENAQVSLLGIEIEYVKARLVAEKNDHGSKIELVEKEWRVKLAETEERWRNELSDSNMALKKRDEEVSSLQSISEVRAIFNSRNSGTKSRDTQ